MRNSTLLKNWWFASSFALAACSSNQFKDIYPYVEIPKYMGSWYVLAGRFTFLEKDVYNSVETYTWNEKEQRIDVDFKYNKGSLNGELKSAPQKAWIENTKTNSHWKVSFFWPIKFDYLIIDMDKEGRWTAVGTPNQKYLWIMARSPENAEAVIAEAVERLSKKGYNSFIETRVQHNPK